MPDLPENSPTVRLEGQPKEYNPEKDPALHRVNVKEKHHELSIELWLDGYKTDIPGAKVNLQNLAEFNKPGKHELKYGDIYFTTASGTIYRAHNLHDGSWQIESSSTPDQNMIREAVTIEVGKRFNSPHLIDDQPELSTSPVQDITVINTSSGQGHRASLEDTDVAARFSKAIHNRKTNK